MLTRLPPGLSVEQVCSTKGPLDGCGGTILFHERVIGWLRWNNSVTPKGHWMAAAEESCSAKGSLDGCGGTILFRERAFGWLTTQNEVGLGVLSVVPLFLGATF